MYSFELLNSPHLEWVSSRQDVFNKEVTDWQTWTQKGSRWWNKSIECLSYLSSGDCSFEIAWISHLHEPGVSFCIPGDLIWPSDEWVTPKHGILLSSRHYYDFFLCTHINKRKSKPLKSIVIIISIIILPSNTVLEWISRNLSVISLCASPSPSFCIFQFMFYFTFPSTFTSWFSSSPTPTVTFFFFFRIPCRGSCES